MVVGDGAFTGGMVYEGLNNAGRSSDRLIVVLNDNEMSIDHNVGGMSSYLSKLRVGQPYNDLKNGIEKALMHIPVAGEKLAKGLKRSKDSLKQIFVPGMFFEEMGVTYIGPIDGHNIRMMEETFRRAFKLNKPILVHVKTIKGKGYKYAEKHPCYFHGISSFDVATGKVKNVEKGLSYTAVFARKLVELGTENNRIVAITAAMSKGTGVNKFAEEFPDRTFDVGIAEEHAVTFAAGLAAEGMIPVVAVYSSFLQRAYDQILHDVCMQNLHVIFAIDRSGLVGADGETHQGIYDPAFLSQTGMPIYSPSNYEELRHWLPILLSHEMQGPRAIRYPRGGESKALAKYGCSGKEYDKLIFTPGAKAALVSYADEVEDVLAAAELLAKEGIPCDVYKLVRIFPFEEELIRDLSAYPVVLMAEECVACGGIGEHLARALQDAGWQGRYIHRAVKKLCLPHATVPQIKQATGLDAAHLAEAVREADPKGEKTL